MTHTLKNLGLTAALAVMMAACTPAPKKDAAPAADAPKTDAPATAAAPTKIVFGTDAAYAPFEMKDASGKIIGFEIDLATAMCAEIKAECTFQDQAFDGIIPALEAKKFDAILSSMSMTAERKEKVDFTQKIWSSPSSFLGAEAIGTDITPASMKDKIIAVQKGTVQENYIKANFKDSKIKSYDTIELAYADLAAKRADLVLADTGVIDDFLKSAKGKNFKELVKVPESVDPKAFGDGIGIAVRKGDKALLDQLNKGFDAIRANGKYKEIADKYFKYDIYTGK